MKLKHLLENSTEHAYTPLTVYEKKNMVETIKAYNEYRKGLKADGVYATAQKIMEAVNLAERYALKECGDWMEAKMVERDMKEIKRDAAKMYEEAQKMKAIEKQLEMLYEEVGRRLERYFEIADPAQISPQSNEVKASSTSSELSQ
jgi:hypothetical protein